MSYGPGIKIIYPRNVVSIMRNKLRAAADLYNEENCID
jgi:hypothetical protein